MESKHPPRFYRWKHSGSFNEKPSRTMDHEEYLSLSEANALADEREARARMGAFEAVLAAAERIYQEEMESDPSDYFFTKKAVEEAQAATEKEER